jgi:uncharacterized protein (TIGR01732 family)
MGAKWNGNNSFILLVVLFVLLVIVGSNYPMGRGYGGYGGFGGGYGGYGSGWFW